MLPKPMRLSGIGVAISCLVRCGAWSGYQPTQLPPPQPPRRNRHATATPQTPPNRRQVNYLGAYQLTRLLAPKLIEGVRAEAAAAAAAAATAPAATTGPEATSSNNDNIHSGTTGSSSSSSSSSSGSAGGGISRVAGRVVAVSSVTHRCYELPADPRLFLHATADITYAWTKSANVRGREGRRGREGGREKVGREGREDGPCIV